MANRSNPSVPAVRVHVLGVALPPVGAGRRRRAVAPAPQVHGHELQVGTGEALAQEREVGDVAGQAGR